MAGKLRYGQFCPVALAAEVVGERWTPLVLRELLAGSRRFNELRRGLPRMSPSLLSRRLRQLARAGVVDRHQRDGAIEYRLTTAGEELRPIIEGLGAWGKRWTGAELDRENLDASLLMWDIRRRVRRDRLPEHRVVVAFALPDAPAHQRRFWLVLERNEVDLCLRDPGHEVDVRLTTDVATMTAIWLGDTDFATAAAAGRLEIDGPSALRRSLPAWLGESSLAGVPRVGGRPAALR